MKQFAIAAALALAACAELYPTVSQVERECGVGDRPFQDSWPCVRGNIARVGASPDVLSYYIAAGDVINERVRLGAMTQDEARLAMVTTEQKARAIETDRVYGASPAVLIAPRGAVPATVNCMTYRVGNTVNTSCH